MRRALNDYMREHVRGKIADETRQQNAVDHLVEFFGEDEPLSSIDIPRSRLYVKARVQGLVGGGKRRKDKRGSLATIRRELNVLTAAANHARKWGRIERMPSIEMPSEERPYRDQDLPYFDAGVMARMFAALDANVEGAVEGAQDDARELRAFVRLAYFTAARRRSIENLTGEQVKLFPRVIVLATPGKRRTKKRQPIVPIFDEMVPDVAWLVGRSPKGRLFRTASFYRPFMALCRALDLPEPHHPHMLRHSRATHLLQSGKDIWDVANLLGDTIRTVEATYGHHSPSVLRSKLS